MTRVIVIVGFLIAFGAGLMVGHVAWMPHPGGMPGGGPHGRPDSWIAQQLDLTPDQQVKMKQIWSDVSHRGGPQQGAKRQQLRHDQEAAIAALIRPEDKPAYDQIIKDYKDRLDALEADNRRQFQQAVEKTKQLLTPEQRTKYEQLFPQRPWEHGDRSQASRGPATTRHD